MLLQPRRLGVDGRRRRRSTTNGPRRPGNSRSGVSSVVNPTRPSLPPSKVEHLRFRPLRRCLPVRERRRSPRASAKSASGISSVRRNCSPRSNVWFPRASASKPIMFMISTSGLSSKKFEIGGVAPPKESPPAIVIEPSVRFGAVAVEPGLQERGAADRERRVRSARAGDVVRGFRERRELGVPVADIEDRDLLVACRAVGTRSVRIVPLRSAGWGCPCRNASVGATSIARMPATGSCLRMPGPAATNVACMLTLCARSTRFGQVAVLAEELRERDPLAGRRRVVLVRRAENHRHVARAARVQSIGAVDVPELLLPQDPEDDLLARVRGVGEALEGGDDLVTDGLVVRRRDDVRRGRARRG